MNSTKDKPVLKPLRQALARIENIKPAIIENIDKHKADWSKRYAPSLFDKLEKENKL